MKTSLVIVLSILSFVTAAVAGAPPTPFITVTPSGIANTNTGVVTLDIMNLTNTEQVIVQTYLDLNGNGVIEAGEPMIDAFKVRDGGAMVIGGITNLNAPFDRNPAGGAISMTLAINPAQIMDNIVGKHIFQLVSPTSRFASTTATLTVTNANLPQSMSGTVYTNGVPAPYAVVVEQDQVLDNPVGGTIADANGHYFVKLPPSSYVPIPTVIGNYYDFNTAPLIILTNGMAATNDLNLTAGGPNTISGTIYDAANTNGIGGLLLVVSSGSYFEVLFTDVNGNYSTAVTPSFWKVEPNRERLPRRAYVLRDKDLQVDATSNSVVNANIPVFKGNAMYHGRLVDNSNRPFVGVELDANANDNSGHDWSAKGYSDTNGYYTVVTMGDSTNFWGIQATSSKNAAFQNYVVNTFNSTNFSGNQVVSADFTALPTTSVISGNVHDNQGTNVSGVTLTAVATINNKNYSALESTTDTLGHYSFAVADGQWTLGFLNGGFDDNLDTHGYVDLTGPHIVNTPPTNVLYNITVYPLGTPFLSAMQRFSSTQFSFNLNGASNVNYTIQYSTNLSSGWSTLLSLQLTNTLQFITDQNATNAVRLYRVQKN